MGPITATLGGAYDGGGVSPTRDLLQWAVLACNSSGGAA